MTEKEAITQAVKNEFDKLVELTKYLGADSPAIKPQRAR